MGRRLLGLALIILAVGVIYAPSLSGYFVSDDVFYLQLSSRLAELPAGELLENLFASAGDSAGTLFYRPLTFASFLADFELWGVEPLGYRLTNLLLHLGNVVVLGVLVRRLADSYWTGLLAALLFALHPVQPESVAWVAARADPLAGLFAVLAVVLFVRRAGHGREHAVLAAAALLMALGSKEPAVMVVPTLSMWAFLTADGGIAQRVGRAAAATWWLWLCLVAYFAVRWVVLGTVLGGHHYVESDPLSGAYWSARIEAVGVLLSPVHLEVLAGGWKPAVLALVVGTIAIGWFAVRDDSRLRSVLLFGAAWSLLALVPAFQMDIDPVNLFGSRVLYSASAALAVLLSISALGIARKSSARVGFAVSLALLVVYVVLTQAHLRFWIEAGRLSGALHREMGLDPRELSPEHQGMLVQVFHGMDGQRGAAVGGGQFAGLVTVERRIVAAAGARLESGDSGARAALVECLLSPDRETRVLAIAFLEQHFQQRRGYDPDAPLADRRAAAQRWR